MSKPSPFPYQSAAITGATSGLGKALSYDLAKRGVNLFLTGRDENILIQIQKELSPFAKIEILALDLSKGEKQDLFFSSLELFKPDLILHAAGFGYYGPVLAYSLHDWTQMIELHVTMSLKIAYFGGSLFIKEKKPGTILFISSAAAFQNFPYFSVYSASKAFIYRFAQSYDTEMKPYNVRILTSCPGMIHTPFRMRASKGDEDITTSWDIDLEKAKEEIIWQILKKKRLHIFDIRYRLGLFLTFFFPKRLVEALLSSSVKKRFPKNLRLL